MYSNMKIDNRFFMKNRNGKCFVVALFVMFVGLWTFFQMAHYNQFRYCRCELPEPRRNTKTAPTHRISQHGIPLLQNSTLFDLLSPHVLVEPSWVQKRDWGLVEDDAFAAIEVKGTSDDRETEFAWGTFFDGMGKGLFLELGAMDGKDFSASLAYEKIAGWKSILIEGDRNDAVKIPKNRPSSLSLQLIICEEPSTYHFVHGPRSVGGILEFMAPDFAFTFHPNLLKDEKTQPDRGVNIKDIIDWDKVKAATHVVEEQCLPLQYVLDRYEITHINFMVLDLEGGELSALKSLDFNRIRFDVMCIETNRMKNPTDPYISEVVNYVTDKGYKSLRQGTIGRNSWFYHPNWPMINMEEY